MSTAAVWSATAVMLALLVAGVALGLAGWEPSAIVGLLAGLGGVASVLVGLIDIASRNHRETQQQTTTLATIDRRTNGELDARIIAGVRAVVGPTAAPATDVTTVHDGSSNVEHGTETVATYGFSNPTVHKG